MHALVFEDGVVRLAERPRPEPGPGEALLRVRRAGICNTDLEIARGYMGFEGVLGHELVGEVIALGAGADAGWLGARVVPEINCACGACAACQRGPNHCPHRTVLGILGRDGGMAEFVAMPTANLHRVPEGLPDTLATFTEPLAAAMHAFDDPRPRAGDRVLVLGDGKLGLLIGFALAERAADLGQAVVVGRHREKLAILAAIGLEVALADEFDERGFDLVVEATGRPEGLEAAFRAVRPRGTVVVKSTYAAGSVPSLAPVVIDELRLVGSRCGPFAPALAALAEGRIDPSPLIAAEYALVEGERAFARAGARGTLKVLLAP